ncbi:hypothetical protein, partial [Myxococcus xanthus]|uniref:hypothetical protein n=1 Tax=Myxococcus xanthus TaxID=34 RepID=UPI0039EF1850
MKKWAVANVVAAQLAPSTAIDTGPDVTGRAANGFSLPRPSSTHRWGHCMPLETRVFGGGLG